MTNTTPSGPARWNIALGVDDDADEPFLALIPNSNAAVWLGKELGKVGWTGSIVFSSTEIMVLNEAGFALTKFPSQPAMLEAIQGVESLRVSIPAGPLRKIQQADVEELVAGEMVAEARLPVVVLPV